MYPDLAASPVCMEGDVTVRHTIMAWRTHTTLVDRRLKSLQGGTPKEKALYKNAAPIRRQYVIGEYLQTKKEYQQKAEEAQTKSWKEFCAAQERETMWENIYWLAELLAQTFYPDITMTSNHLSQIRPNYGIEELGLARDDPLFISEELQLELKALNPKKAFGPDG
ncbi:hypothetical protein EVAR_67787_1 [Eumeta japonica]|uniref:Uncharacterized protein n=1 Tax=Eumeta variegata TaxID=151549 RepID=A0A4C1ZYI3_EUMVA|nr:hypothetical protein EVAR_67787_1 [Eumeta japonica]